MHDDVYADIEDLRARIGAATNADVFQNALKVYRVLLRRHGDRATFIDSTGAQSELDVLGVSP
ncbi:MAG: hypothetical protein ACR2P5_03275 [Gammaproteobacteria bacterium]